MGTSLHIILDHDPRASVQLIFSQNLKEMKSSHNSMMGNDHSVAWKVEGKERMTNLTDESHPAPARVGDEKVLLGGTIAMKRVLRRGERSGGITKANPGLRSRLILSGKKVEMGKTKKKVERETATNCCPAFSVTAALVGTIDRRCPRRVVS